MNTLIIISIILSVIVIGLLILQFVVKPKSSLSTLDIINTIEKENEKLRKEMQNGSLSQSDTSKRLNDMILETIKSYNGSMLERLNLSKDMEKESLDGLDKKIFQLTQLSSSLANQVDEKLQKINEDNVKQLNQMRETVDEKLNVNLTNRLNESYAIISERLDAIQKNFGEIQGVTTGVDDIKKMLGNVKVRGTFGEVQLNALLEQMLSGEQYLQNVQIKNNSSERCDFAIKLPGKDEKNILLPIDAKFPLEDYLKLVDCKDKKEELQYLKQLETRIKAEAKSISSKYIFPPNTTDFAIMYIPVEGLYAEILKMPGLTDLIQRQFRIIICCPTTLAALLSSLQMGFKTLYIEKRSSEIWELLASFRREFGTFIDLLGKTQKKLLEANDTIEDATKKTQKIQKQLMNVTSSAPEFLIEEDKDEK